LGVVLGRQRYPTRSIVEAKGTKMRLGTELSAFLIGGLVIATPQMLAAGNDTDGAAPAVGGSGASVSSSASASASASSSETGCTAEATASAEARSGSERQKKIDHKQVTGGQGPCRANAAAAAKAGPGTAAVDKPSSN
jgi:hypothetical protein